MSGHKAEPEAKPAGPGVEVLTSEIGWLLITARVLGVILPGVPGAPFLVVGGFVVTPGGKRMLNRWAANNPPTYFTGALKQIGRFVEDLERRYPKLPG